MKRYQQLARALSWVERTTESKNPYRTNAEEAVERIMASAPSGSGIDSGTKLLDSVMAKPSKDYGRMASAIRLQADYHHINEGGYYDGWTEHTIIIRPSLEYGFTMRITGRDRNQIKDYLHEIYECWLNEEVGEEYK